MKAPFQKKDGVPRLGRWFCSHECAEQDAEIQQIELERQSEMGDYEEVREEPGEEDFGSSS